jgi:NitT/TauT family transport system substrate-binding protein
MKRVILVMISMALLFSLSGCGGNENSLRVGTWKTAQTIQPFFYEDYISDKEIEIIPFTNPGDMKTALLSGSLDMCGSTLVTAITARSKGESVVVLTGLSNGCSAFVVKKDSGIKEVKDFKGKKIAYVPGTMHHLLLLEALEQGGLNPEEDVELIRIDFFDMGQALKQGDIDAFYSGEPYPAMAVLEGYGEILLYPDDETGFGTINSVMITTQDMIEENSEVIEELVYAHHRATVMLNYDKEAWIDKSLEFGVAEDVLDLSMENIDLFWDIDEAYIKRVEKLAIRMKEQGMIEEIPDIRAMFFTDYVDDIREEYEE